MSRVSRSSLWSLCLARLALVAAGGLARVVLIDVRPDVDERHAAKLAAVAANLCEKLPGTPVVFFHHSAAAAAAAALARAHACVAPTTAVDAQIPGLEGFSVGRNVRQYNALLKMEAFWRSIGEDRDTVLLAQADSGICGAGAAVEAFARYDYSARRLLGRVRLPGSTEEAHWAPRLAVLRAAAGRTRISCAPRSLGAIRPRGATRVTLTLFGAFVRKESSRETLAQGNTGNLDGGLLGEVLVVAAPLELGALRRLERQDVRLLVRHALPRRLQVAA